MKHLTIATVTLALVLWILFKLLAVYTNHGETAEVPDFKGKTITELNNFVADKSVGYVIIDSIYDPKEQSGIVIKQDPEAKSGSIIPVAFPIIAGSGTLTTVMTLRANYGFYNILIGILINLIAVYIVLRSINYLERKLGKSGLFVIRKFFGVILLAIAVKMFKTNFAFS